MRTEEQIREAMKLIHMSAVGAEMTGDKDCAGSLLALVEALSWSLGGDHPHFEKLLADLRGLNERLEKFNVRVLRHLVQ